MLLSCSRGTPIRPYGPLYCLTMHALCVIVTCISVSQFEVHTFIGSQHHSSPRLRRAFQTCAYHVCLVATKDAGTRSRCGMPEGMSMCLYNGCIVTNHTKI